MERITSAQNPTIKFARKLLKSSGERHRTRKILLDGAHLVQSYAARYGLSEMVLLLDEAALNSGEISSLVEQHGHRARILVTTSQLLRGISPVDTPSGIIAICGWPKVEEIAPHPVFSLLLDGVQDPGNLGSILRTAAATGASEVFLSSSCADPWSPKCLRGGMGAQFVLPVKIGVDVFTAISSFYGTTIATSPHAGQALMNAMPQGPVLAMFGGEGAGLGREVMEAADLTVRIPLQRQIDSLNVAATVAIVCYERLRCLSQIGF